MELRAPYPPRANACLENPISASDMRRRGLQIRHQEELGILLLFRETIPYLLENDPLLVLSH